jgi:hypothetical protein
MREPVAKRRPMIDLEQFERRLRQPEAVPGRDEDPLAELARLVGQQDPYKGVFEPQGRNLAPARNATRAWEESQRSEPDGAERLSGDFAAIEAGLLAPQQHESATLDEAEEITGFSNADNESQHWRYEDDALPVQSEIPGGEIRSRRPLYLMAAVIVVGIAGIGASFALKNGSGASHEVATIKAADGPVKIQPEATASADVSNQDASILNRAPQPSAVALVNNAEQPVDLSQAQEKPPRVIALGGSRVRSDNGLVGGAASVPVPAPPMQSQPQGDGLSIAGLIEPKKVKTVSVRPDGTLLPNDRTPQTASAVAPLPASRPATTTAKAATPKSTARVATTPKSVPVAATEAGQPAQSAKPKPVQMADAQPGAAPSTSNQVSGGAFAVQLAAPESEQEARDIQVRLMKKFGSEIPGFHPSIRKALNGDKTVYRVRSSGLSRDEANALCKKVQSGGGNCFVAKN